MSYDYQTNQTVQTIDSLVTNALQLTSNPATGYVMTCSDNVGDASWQPAGGVSSLQGTANQVLVSGTSGSPEDGDLILTTPQDIAPASSPTFVTETLSGLTPSALVSTDASKVLQSATIGTNMVFSGNSLSVSTIPVFTQVTVSGVLANNSLLANNISKRLVTVTIGSNINFISNTLSVVATPSFTSVALSAGAAAGYLLTSDAVGNASWTAPLTATSLTGTANQVLVNGTSGSAQTGAMTLSLPQAIGSGSSPSFAGQTLSGLTASTLLYANASKLISSATIGANLSLTSGTLAVSATPSFTSIALSAGAAAGYLLSSDSAGNASWAAPPASSSGTGTTNQVLVNGTSGSPQTGALTFTLPQSIGTGSSPTFAALKLTTGATANYVLRSDASGNTTWAASSAAGTANQVLVNGTTGSAQIGALTFTLPQSIGTGSAVQFGSMMLNTSSAPTSINTIRLYANGGNINLDNGYQLSLRSDVGTESSGGYWMGFNSSNATGGSYQVATLINVNGDTGTKRPIFFTTSSNSAITGTLAVGTSIWPVVGAVSIGRTYATSIAPNDGLIVQGQVGVGTTAPVASAALDITSTTQGFKLPVMTGTQRAAISSPATGLQAFDSTDSVPYSYDGTAWQPSPISSSFTPTYAGVLGVTSVTNEGCFYTRLSSKMVIIFGNAIVVSSGATSFQWTMTLPTSVTFSSSVQAIGTMTSGQVTNAVNFSTYNSVLSTNGGTTVNFNCTWNAMLISTFSFFVSFSFCYFH